MALKIELLEQDGNIALLSLQIGATKLMLLARITHDAHKLTPRDVHVEGKAANVLGLRGLYRIACATMKELFDVEQIVVLGAIRTSGAKPGHRPREIRFSRRHCRTIGLA